MWLSRVVLPLPRKPVRTVTGTRGLLDIIFGKVRARMGAEKVLVCARQTSGPFRDPCRRPTVPSTVTYQGGVAG